MTPKMIGLFHHALDVCLDTGCYDTLTTLKGSRFMCHAFDCAAEQELLSKEDAQKAQSFLSRWVRWQSHVLKCRTITISCIDMHLNPNKVPMYDSWFDDGYGIEYYEALIERLKKKYARTSH